MNVYSGFNLITIAFLVIISFTLIGLHKIGLMNIELQLIDENVAQELSDITTNNVHFETLTDQKSLKIICKIKEIKSNTLCGVSVVLWKNNLNNGLDLSQYDRIKLSLNYRAPNAQSKTRVSFRTYHPRYSTSDDFVSLKYNSITYQPDSYSSEIVVPLSAFRVEQWWIDQLNLGFDDAKLDFSNVSMFEVVTNNITTPGEYEIAIISAVLYGEGVSETNLLKILLFIWLVSVIALTTRQRNILRASTITDELTNLLNRRGGSSWTLDKLSSRNESNSLWLLYFDLDDFKKINDSYGHRLGDQTLQVFAAMLKHNLSKFDDSHYALSRLSGDEFSLIIERAEFQQISELAHNIYNNIQSPFQIGDYKIKISASLGIAQVDDDITTFESFIAKADSAMYFAKKKGKNQFHFFDEEVAQGIAFNKDIAEKLSHALTHSEFMLNYMPIMNIKDSSIGRVEVLIRCTSDSLKGIGPDIFIPVAEAFDLIKSIDLWVIETVFRNINKNRDFLTKHPIVFCINLSGSELKNEQFIPQLAHLLQQYAIEPNQIELEITETTLVETDIRTIGILNGIRDLGVTLALDDFGTGYTAFGQLIKYPVSCLKIDKSFIDGLSTDDKTQVTMVEAILSIAQAYDLEIIAEGVEEEKQYHDLKQRGCDMIQGYLLSKPLVWDDFINFYKTLPLRSFMKAIPSLSGNSDSSKG